MKPKFLQVPCCSNDEYGDLQDCYAFVDFEGLKEIQNLMRDLKEQRPSSTILQGMYKFPFDDAPISLVDNDELRIIGKRFPLENADHLCFVEDFEVNEDVNIWHSDLELIFLENELFFQYRMEAKDCQTTVFSNSINENTLNDILEQWEQIAQRRRSRNS